MISGTISTGEDVQITAFDGESVELISPRAFAPGAPCALVVALSPELPMTLKCHGSKRIDDGRFQVRGRAIALRRDDRERLVRSIADESI